MKVNLTYFRSKGKYFSTGSYDTTEQHIYKIFEEVMDLAIHRELPGLIEGHEDFHILIDVPDHEHNHPHLIPIESIKELAVL